MRILLLVLLALPVQAEEFVLKSDGIGLPGLFEPADGFAEDAAPKVAVLLHGSGPNDRDEDLTAVSDPASPCLFFRDLSAALRRAGVSVVRYDKRSFVYKNTPKALVTPAFAAYKARPLEGTLSDAALAVAWARARAPKARIVLVGHSEGSYLALQTAHRDAAVAGTALIGLGLTGIETAVFEQTVYRPFSLFTGLDSDSDGRLAPEELAGEEALKASLRAQMGLVDRDKDGALSADEFKGGQLSNLLMGPSPYAAFNREQAALPSPADILRGDAFPVAVFNGALDNQTPAYGAWAVDLANAAAWKRKNLSVSVLPGLGHALDRRKGYGDLTFRAPDPSALAAVAAAVAAMP
ncbi:MAG: alpha/beta fold hydrolase [Elusimicrobia bacterium]|nr:alpha/beta fold hydrolase [Elusimicrobiota bacterium]